MRPLVIAAALVIATSVFAPVAAAAQDPDSSPPPARQPQDVAVPRAQAPAPAPTPAAPPPERRGAVRAPERAVERPVPVETSDEGRQPRAAGNHDNQAVPRSAVANAEASAAASDEQRGQRRGGVRQPPDDRGTRTRDRAVPRGEAPPPTRTTIVRNYPYRYSPYRYDPYYSRYYDPWGYGSFGLGYFYYSPWAWTPYASYGYPGYYPPYGAAYGFDVGSVKFKVRPRDAEVWVDGYYAGTVDDFDGVFQALRLDSGPYRIEIRKPGFETLVFDVRVQPDRTVTFRGEMRPLP